LTEIPSKIPQRGANARHPAVKKQAVCLHQPVVIICGSAVGPTALDYQVPEEPEGISRGCVDYSPSHGLSAVPFSLLCSI